MCETALEHSGVRLLKLRWKGKFKHSLEANARHRVGCEGSQESKTAPGQEEVQDLSLDFLKAVRGCDN